ncbi:AAA family ATPase [Pseudomonas kribbensis]|uniref:AAA family ATPase n=1 Tax=Pseudomonas kribbensis TaxID=1628086 RepID=UPI003BF7924B
MWLDTLAPLIKEHLPELIADAERRRAPVDALAPLLETHLADAPPTAMEEVEALISELLAKHYYAPYRSDPGPVGNRHLSGQRLSYYRRSSADLHEAVGRRHPVILATTSEPRRQARELIDAARVEDRTVYIWTLASGLFEINWDDEGTRSFLPATPQRIRTALQRTSQFDDPIQRMILLHVMEENRLGSTEGGLSVFIDVKSRFASTDVYLFVDDVDENGDPVPFDGDLGDELQAALSERMHEIEQMTAGKHYPGNDPKNPFALAELVGYIVEQRPSNALIVIQDVDQYLDKSMDRIASHTASVLRDASIRLGRLEQGPQMVLLGSELSAPANLTREVLQLQLPLPTARELTACFRKILPREFGWGDTSPPEDPHATNDDLLRLAQSASGMSLSEATEAIRSGLQSSNGDAERLLQSVQRAKRSGVRVNPALEVVDTSALSASLGGMESFMSWLQPREKVFKHPDKARDAGIGRAPRGVLLLGIPGTGKSLAAKEIARRWGFSLVRLDMGALQDKWLGESERNIRSALRIVDAMSPCILWIDEIDKGLGQEHTHSAAQNVNATLLTWLQESRAPAFVVATANRFGGLPPELTRAGRFDGRFFFGCPGAEGRLEILRIHLAARNCELSEAPLNSVISLTEGFTGAELEQVVLDGLYAAFAEDRPLSIKDLQQACHGVKPLVASVGKGLDEIWALIDHGRVTPASEHMLNRTQLMKLIDPQRFRPIYCRLENIEGWDQISSRGAVSLMDDPYRGAAAIVLETGDDQWALVQTNVYAEKGDRWHWKFLDRVETLGINGVFDVLITEHCVEVILFESPSTLSRFAEHEYLGAYAELFQVVGRGREFAGFSDAQVVKS